MFLLTTKTAFWRIDMFRLLKALPVVLGIVAIVALGVFAASCGSGGNALVRVVNAIPDNSESLDVDVNGTKDFPSVAFDTVYPTPTTPASYTPVPSGSVSIEAFIAGQTTNPIVAPTTTSLSASTQYTVLLGGFPGSSPSAYLLPDNNTVPTTGNVNIRVIDGSAVAGSNGIDVVIYQTGTNPPPVSQAQVVGLPLGQASSYLSLTYESNYSIQVYQHGNGNPLFNFGFAQGGSSSAGPVTTLVILDNPAGTAIYPTPIVLSDLN
jgi:hypothetical protein